MGRIATNYYQQLFKSNNPQIIISSLIVPIPTSRQVSPQMNANLCRQVTNEEVHQAVFSIGATQAPGPDGFPGIFFIPIGTFWGPILLPQFWNFFLTENF